MQAKWLQLMIEPEGRKQLHLYSALLFLCLIALSLPISLFLLSSGMIGLAINWLLEGDFRQKWIRLRENKALLWFLIIYPVHLLWLLNTKDFNYGAHDIRIKLPLLVMPLIIGTSGKLSQTHLRLIFYSFITGCFVASILAVLRYKGILHTRSMDLRDISGSLSHIRLSLMVNLAIFLLAERIVQEPGKRWRVILSLLTIWFVAFVFFLKSGTGIVIFLLIAGLMIAIYQRKTGLRWVRVIILTGLVIIPASIIIYSFHAVKRFYTIHIPDQNSLELKTVRGNIYWHDWNSKAIENGYPVNLYICETELRETWNLKSDIPYDSLDQLHQPLKSTLIRYLTSKGLRKDQDGVNALSPQDISLIESGIANCIYADRLGIYPYLYRIIWEIHDYRSGGNPSGHSITQRIEYTKTAWYIFRHHLWLGTGTGDVARSFSQAYEDMHSELSMEWRKRAHNQYLTFMLTFGLIGFILVMAGMIVPIIILRKQLDSLDLIFLLIAGLSMINEDTLETHAGVSFVSFFVALLLFGHERIKNQA